MIIVDYSGIALASIIINKTFDEGLIRHMILNSLRMYRTCLLYTSPSPRDRTRSRMPSSA